jgi:hypothetical protein
MSENRVLRRRLEVHGEGSNRKAKKINNEACHNLNSSPDIIRVIKSRRISWVGRVARSAAINIIQHFGKEMWCDGVD